MSFEFFHACNYINSILLYRYKPSHQGIDTLSYPIVVTNKEIEFIKSCKYKDKKTLYISKLYWYIGLVSKICKKV
jgi:hypothetical protein